METDVVIVGAGPAGSVAAKRIADSGIKVLVLEKRQEIGAPKRCAEGINTLGLENVGIKPNPRWAINEIRGGILYSPSGKKVVIQYKDKLGYILERKMFEKFLASEAIKKGAKYMVKTRALGVTKENNKVSGVKAEFMGDVFEVKSKIVIAADGVDSLMAKSTGLKTLNKLTDYHSGFQYEMAGLKNIRSDVIHIFLGDDIAPKGYVWIFPKSEHTANVGVGVLGLMSGDGYRAKDYLDKFIKTHSEIFENSSPIEINTGGIPVSSCAETFITDGFMAIGDAAQQVNPIHGGGIALAMNAAKIASDVAVKAIKEGNFSKERLYEYEDTWRKTDGVRMKKLLKLRHFLEKLEEKDFEVLADILSSSDIMDVTEGKYGFLLKLFMSKAPDILPLAKKFLSE